MGGGHVDFSILNFKNNFKFLNFGAVCASTCLSTDPLTITYPSFDHYLPITHHHDKDI